VKQPWEGVVGILVNIHSFGSFAGSCPGERKQKAFQTLQHGWGGRLRKKNHGNSWKEGVDHRVLCLAKAPASWVIFLHWGPGIWFCLRDFQSSKLSTASVQACENQNTSAVQVRLKFWPGPAAGPSQEVPSSMSGYCLFEENLAGCLMAWQGGLDLIELWLWGIAYLNGRDLGR
jgi:hypothetical protein